MKRVGDVGEQGVFMRVASAIGDLGSPFYDEERQRDVWNEASAVGFQAMLWSSLVAANVMIWVGGAAASPYTLSGDRPSWCSCCCSPRTWPGC